MCDDRSSLKKHTLGYIKEDPFTPLDPPLILCCEKAERGLAHPDIAELLVPLNLKGDAAYVISLF